MEKKPKKNYVTVISNQLDKKEIYLRLNDINFKKNPRTLFELLEDNQSKIIYFYDLLEKNKDYYKINKIYNNVINPILWQLGHINMFYIKYVINLLKKEYNKTLLFEINDSINKSFKRDDIHSVDYYDSFVTSLYLRFMYLKDIDITKLKECYKKIILFLKNYIKYYSYEFEFVMNNIDNYLIYLGILHNDMHYEGLLFTSNYLGFTKPSNLKFYEEYYYSSIYNNQRTFNKIIENKWINIKGGYFLQGFTNEKHNKNIHFDNEQPQFKTYIKDFVVSKYPITEGEYLYFIKNNGYNIKKYWCINGWEFIKNKEIDAPLYWNKKFGIPEDTWYIEDWCGRRDINIHTNKPVRNISWYEAEAYCRWKDVRLIKESEWEYLATNKGQTLFPWGNDKPNYLRCNIDYKNTNIVDVNYFETINVFTNQSNDRYDSLNNDKVSQLIGNIWEWCEESIYPYDGFKIDPVYREMSYPCFGIKKICRGGCWATSSYLINSKYRNAQGPDCRIQWIGFRVCKK